MRLDSERPGLVRLTATAAEIAALASAARVAITAVGSTLPAEQLKALRQCLAELDRATPALDGVVPHGASEPEVGMFHDGSRELQERFDTTRIAKRIEDLLVRDTIERDQRAFIEDADMFFLATADELGRPTCSYKGGDPGFVTVVDPRTLAFPSYDGNGMFLSLGNMSRNRYVGLLFLDLERGHRMRVHGTASVDPDDPLLAEHPEAQLVVRVRVREVFPNCPRYVHRYQLVRRSSFVPRSGCVTPVPEWKRSDWAVDALPVADPARNPGARPVLGR
jgi:predicted pyridoxine 5'-phosphate oxidase superfamily flavin-nucleotide-binding protein